MSEGQQDVIAPIRAAMPYEWGHWQFDHDNWVAWEQFRKEHPNG